MIKLKKKLISFAAAASAALLTAQSAFASSQGNAVSNSTLATGTKKLLNDVMSWLQILAPIAGALFVVYFAIRKGGAEEQDQKMWQKRINTAIICVVIAELASTIINLISSYYM